MLGQLVPCGGGRPIPLLKPKLLVGRQVSCDIPLPFTTVSSRHCELELQDGCWYVHDLGSKNGIRINNTTCTSGQLLPNAILAVAGHRYAVVYHPPAGMSHTQQPSKLHAPPLENAAAETMAEMPFGRLIPCGGGDTIALHQKTVVVGRHESCDVVLRLNTVSSRHCQLEWTDKGWFVRDLASRNGIRVDGVRCEEKLLAPGSILSIAGQRYEVAYNLKGAAPAKPRLFMQSLLEAAGLTREPPEPPANPGGM
jgi:pSer/pThr/pTyr-binding forkhead associated (FHA) protein